ncbi:CbtB domain-containing protein [Pseudoduganella chitinolytica]|uniref:CbtB-domain containing protein n=1 Tax=Pseudoduganella chitinolytica TaxID=34070 RepID=A0ABY8BFY8_9BURK|nr:CbtB domain-containing protein [Pseudoduganella chitinolytica]WEF34820.1 CbtB-domain containing protein [Pseudoduganella chitinolytica]
MSPVTSHSVEAATPLALKDKLVPALGAAALGIVLLFGAGFAPMEALHNAAHDSRHSAGFPCH